MMEVVIKKRGRPRKIVAPVTAAEPTPKAQMVVLIPSTVSEMASNINAATMLRTMDYYEQTRVCLLDAHEGAVTMFAIRDVLFNNYSLFMAEEDGELRRKHVSVGICSFNRSTIFNLCRAGNSFVLLHLGKAFFYYPLETQACILKELPNFDPFSNIRIPSVYEVNFFAGFCKKEEFELAALNRPVQFFSYYYALKMAVHSENLAAFEDVWNTVKQSFPMLYELSKNFRSNEELQI